MTRKAEEMADLQAAPITLHLQQCFGDVYTLENMVSWVQSNLTLREYKVYLENLQHLFFYIKNSAFAHCE